MMKTMAEPEKELRLSELPDDLIERGHRMADRGRDVWLAGLGALETMEEEGSSFFHTLVKRGRRIESRAEKRFRTARKEVDDLMGDLATRRRDITHSVEETLSEPLIGALRRFGVPTVDEVRDLSKRVNQLTKKVDALIRALEPAPASQGIAAPEMVRVFTVVNASEGWVVKHPNDNELAEVYPTKDEAIRRARDLAHAAPPSQLMVYKKDGSVQETFDYPT
jgi:poly(hydroxyalkanoate) granule-associated protein